MSGRLNGKRAFVTAAAQGIGRATALAFAAEGAEVIATDVNTAKLAELAAPGLRTATLDVLDAAAVKAAAADAGAIDILFNCVGFVFQGTVLEVTEEEFTFAFDLNVHSMVRTIQAFLPGMVERRSGAVVNVASVVSSLKGFANRAIYSASKGAVIGLTKSVAADFTRHGIRCNAICPGSVLSPSLEERIAANSAAAGGIEAARAFFVGRQLIGRLGRPEEIAALAVYLASEEAEFVTGQTIVWPSSSPDRPSSSTAAWHCEKVPLCRRPERNRCSTYSTGVVAAWSVSVAAFLAALTGLSGKP